MAFDSTFLVMVVVMMVNLYLIANPPKNLGLMNFVVGLFTIVFVVYAFISLSYSSDEIYQYFYALIAFFGVFTIFRGDGLSVKSR